MIYMRAFMCIFICVLSNKLCIKCGCEVQYVCASLKFFVYVCSIMNIRSLFAFFRISICFLIVFICLYLFIIIFTFALKKKTNYLPFSKYCEIYKKKLGSSHAVRFQFIVLEFTIFFFSTYDIGCYIMRSRATMTSIRNEIVINDRDLLHQTFRI